MNKAAMDRAGELAKTLHCIAHPLRLLIVCMLSGREMFVGELIAGLGTSKGNISQHLRLLADNGLVSGRREGNRVIYSIKDVNLVKLLSSMRKLYCPGLKV